MGMSGDSLIRESAAGHENGSRDATLGNDLERTDMGRGNGSNYNSGDI